MPRIRYPAAVHSQRIRYPAAVHSQRIRCPAAAQSQRNLELVRFRSPAIAPLQCSPEPECTPDCCKAARGMGQFGEAFRRGMRIGRRWRERRSWSREECSPWRGCSSLRGRGVTWIGWRRIVVVGGRVSVGGVGREANWHLGCGRCGLPARNGYAGVSLIVDEGAIVYFAAALRTELPQSYLW
jgi:hypothetical protein